MKILRKLYANSCTLKSIKSTTKIHIHLHLCKIMQNDRVFHPYKFRVKVSQKWKNRKSRKVRHITIKQCTSLLLFSLGRCTLLGLSLSFSLLLVSLKIVLREYLLPVCSMARELVLSLEYEQRCCGRCERRRW